MDNDPEAELGMHFGIIDIDQNLPTEISVRTFFENTWTHNSNVPRVEAVSILSEGKDPHRILLKDSLLGLENIHVSGDYPCLLGLSVSNLIALFRASRSLTHK